MGDGGSLAELPLGLSFTGVSLIASGVRLRSMTTERAARAATRVETWIHDNGPSPQSTSAALQQDGSIDQTMSANITHDPPHAVRHILGSLLAFVAINAFAGGWYGLAGAKEVPVEWLAGSPFADYFIPSLILFVVVGGTFFIAALAVFAGLRSARLLAAGAGVVALGWIAVQVAILGFVSWLQPATAVAGALVLSLARRLPAAAAHSVATVHGGAST